MLADELDAARIVLGAVPAVHGGKNAVGPGLQRHVKMLRNAVCGSEQGDEIPRHIERLDRTDAQALDPGFVQNAAKQTNQLNARRKIAAIGAQIDATEHNFAVARLAEPLNLFEYLAGRKAAALPSHERNHAVRAAAGATVLDFQHPPGVVSFSARDGSSQERRPLEEVAQQNLCWTRLQRQGPPKYVARACAVRGV